MSKRIIAIALFATMVLSLFSVANATWEGTKTFGVYVYNATGLAEDSTKDIEISTVTAPATESGKTTTLKGKYDDFRKVPSLYAAGNQVKYAVDIVFDGTVDLAEAEGIKVDSFTGKSGTIKLIDLKNKMADETDSTVTAPPYAATGDFYGLRYVFTLQKGGNEQKIVLRAKDTAGSIIEFTHTIKFEDTSSSGKPVKDLSFDIKAIPTTDGIYHAYVLGGVLFVDVAKDLAAADSWEIDDAASIHEYVGTADYIYQPLGFEFYADGARVPAKNKAAYVYKGDDTSSGDKAFLGMELGNYYTDANAYRIKNDETAKLPIKLTGESWAPSSFKIAIEDENYIYKSGKVNLVWRYVPRNEITNVVVNEKNLTIKVGETYEVTINKAHSTTYQKIGIKDDGQQRIVLIDGAKLTGLAVGTTTLYVYPGTVQQSTLTPEGLKIIDTIVVNVVAADAAPAADDLKTYRVIAQGNLNRRQGPGTSYAIVGKFAQNTIFKGSVAENGWIAVEGGGYVSAQYALEVAATTAGNYVVTASNLNVRKAPNGAIVTKYPYGTVVNVVGYNGSWAQLDNGNFVASAYLKAK